VSPGLEVVKSGFTGKFRQRNFTPHANQENT
jgi:hypothetical protein